MSTETTPANRSNPSNDESTSISHVSLWGPAQIDGTQGLTEKVVRERKPWGLIDILWGVLFLIGAQVVLLPVLSLMAIAAYDIPMDGANAAQALTEGVSKITTTGPGLVAALLSQWVAFVGAAYLASVRKGHRSLAKDFGFVFKKTDVPFGLLLAVALQAFMFAANWLLTQTSLDLEGSSNTGQVTDHTGILLVIMVLAASIGAPLTEEIFFRGLILRGMLRGFARVDHAPVLTGRTETFRDRPASSMRRQIGTVAAVVLSSVIFGLMHLQTSTGADGSTQITLGHWIVVAQTGLLGMVFAVIAVKTKRIGLPIVGHFFFNSISLALVFLTT